MIKGIVFDKDGTLLDYEAFWLPVARGAIEALIAAHGVDASHTEALLSAIGAYDGIRGVLCYGTYAMIADAMNGCLADGSAVFSAEAVSAAFHNSISLGTVLPTCDDIASVMAACKARGLVLALVTSDNRALTEVSLDALGIHAYFDTLYTDDGMHPAKPDPYYMETFCQAYGLAPEEVLMVGDTQTDMRFAENSGVRAVGVAQNERDKAVLAPLAYRVADDISAIPALVDEMNRGAQ